MSPLSSSAIRIFMLAALVSAALCARAAEGEVKKLDMAQGKVTIKAGEIKNLDMPAMTMAFKARPITLLNGLAVGDAITFEAAKMDGQYVVTAIKKR
jgi:Cu(I)/Ag(I) efflux system periplasmic protein CusF